MFYLNHFLWGLAMASVGITLPGMVNMTSVNLSIRRGIRSAIHFSAGAAITVFFQAFIAVAFAGYIARHPEVFQFLKKAAVVLLLLFSLIFLYQALRNKAVEARKGKGHSFLLGILVAGMNVLTIPFFFAFSTFLKANDWLSQGLAPRLFFVSGASIGALLLLAGYAHFAQFIAGRVNSLSRNMNFIMSGFFLLLAMLQIAQMYYG